MDWHSIRERMIQFLGDLGLNAANRLKLLESFFSLLGNETKPFVNEALLKICDKFLEVIDGQEDLKARFKTIVIRKLKDHNPHVRQRAVEIVGKRKMKEAAEALIVKLNDYSPYVIREAARVLGEFREEKALDALIGQLLEGNLYEDVQLVIVVALAEIGGDRAKEALEKKGTHSSNKNVKKIISDKLSNWGAPSGDPASLSDVGGVDFNEIKLQKEGQSMTTSSSFDPAMLQKIIDDGVDGFAPVIINFVPISSIFPLLGLKDQKKTLLTN